MRDMYPTNLQQLCVGNTDGTLESMPQRIKEARGRNLQGVPNNLAGQCVYQ